MVLMLKDEILEKIFSDSEMQKIPVGCQSTAVNVFDRLIVKMVKENPYAELSTLLSDE